MNTLMIVLLASAGLSIAPDEGTKDDKDKLQGTWLIQSVEAAGDRVPKEDIENIRLTIEGDKYTETRDKAVEEKGTLKLDPTKSPKTIDFAIKEGMSEGETQLGIYKLDDDTLTLCLADPGDKERPKEFATKAGSRQFLIVFKREKP
jgi:uncharacterized protein (TIGR03067 family)